LPPLPDLPSVEMVELEMEFTRLMKERFLGGEDGAFVDYRQIDNDATLDAEWQREEDQDMEDRYFDEDD